MKKSRFKDSQILEAIKRVEAGLTVLELCRDILTDLGIPPFLRGLLTRSLQLPFHSRPAITQCLNHQVMGIIAGHNLAGRIE